MDRQSQSNQAYSQLEPASFSFQNSLGHQTHQPLRSFSKCLRLKTHQSLQGQSSTELIKEVKNSMINGHDSSIINDHFQRLAQEEYDLRTESLIKQYELRLSKQQEYYGLRQWKMKQQMQHLEKQTISLSQQLRRARLNQKQVQQKCTLCGDGQVIAQYNKLLTQNQEHHKDCLTSKKELIRRAQEAESKYSVLEEEHEKVCQQLRSQHRQIRSYKSKVSQLQTERDSAFQSLSQLDNSWKQKAIRLENQSKQLQRQLMQKQNQVSQLNVSKATVQSTQSVLTNPHFSMKSSMLKPKYMKEDKQNMMVRPRGSLSKAVAIDQDDQHGRPCLKKLSENMPRNIRTASVKNDSLRWKRY